MSAPLARYALILFLILAFYIVHGVVSVAGSPRLPQASQNVTAEISHVTLSSHVRCDSASFVNISCAGCIYTSPSRVYEYGPCPHTSLAPATRLLYHLAPEQVADVSKLALRVQRPHDGHEALPGGPQALLDVLDIADGPGPSPARRPRCLAEVMGPRLAGVRLHQVFHRLERARPPLGCSTARQGSKMVNTGSAPCLKVERVAADRAMAG